MKRFLTAALAAFLCFVPPAIAANTATAQTAQRIYIGGNGPVVPYVLAFDTTGTDLTIVTPDTGKMACVAGIFGAETSATNITFKSGTTTYAVPEMAALSPMFFMPLGNNILFCTQPGEALKMQVSTAVSNLLIHVVIGSSFNFSRF